MKVSQFIKSNSIYKIVLFITQFIICMLNTPLIDWRAIALEQNNFSLCHSLKYKKVG